MPDCSECESPLDIDQESIDEGDVVVCDECGAEYEVVAIDPLQLAPIERDDLDDEENADFYEEDEDEE
jgi:alpha-aminoadipate carrier protein LysW